MRLYVPDGQSISVEWYITEGRATGVEKISDDWIPKDIGPKRDAGFSDDRAALGPPPLPRRPAEATYR